MNNKKDEKIPEQTALDFEGKTYTFGEDNKRATTFHDFNEEAVVMGELTAIEEGSNGKIYQVKTSDGKQITIGSYGVLQSKILPNDVGKILKVAYLGKKKSQTSKWDYMDFDVFMVDK